MPYYGVRSGHTVGVLDNWEDCEESVSGFSNNEYRRFSTYEEAESYADGYSESYDYGQTGEQEYCEPEEPEEDEDYHGEVYVDGCCLGNGQPDARAGIGIYWGDDSQHNISARLKGVQTNQRAAIEAAKKAITQAKQQGYKSLDLYTDSKYFKQCMEEYVPKWEVNGWRNSKGHPVVHAAEYQAIAEEMEDGPQTNIIHVNAHSGIYENDKADRLAKRGAEKPYNYGQNKRTRRT